MRKSTAVIGSTALIIVLGASIVFAQGMRLRFHDEITVKPVVLKPATVNPGDSIVTISTSTNAMRIVGNGIPDHLVGRFPNSSNPNRISEQNVALTVPLSPRVAGRSSELKFGWNFGVSLHGVVFDPLAAEFWAGDRNSGWSYNALGGAIALGLDENYAHVQPSGSYHYHGIPTGLVELLAWSADRHSPLVGYAADGFPIYAITGTIDGKVTEMTSSYRLKSGNRPGGSAPGGTYDGTFLEDFEYVRGAGNLDECNGAITVSPEYPSGTYAYFLTNDYPVIPRCFAGTPDQSFMFGRRR